MGRSIFDCCRRVTTAFALGGVLAYSALIPGHIVSQLLTQLTHVELGVETAANSNGDHCDPDKSKRPGEPKKHCPFCAGHAAFQVYTAAAATFVPPQPAVASSRLAFNDERSLRKVALLPRSRDPPSLPA